MFVQRTEQTIEPMLLTTRQAARLLNISERNLFGLTKSRAIPAVRFGRSVRYDPRDLDAWIQSAKKSHTAS